MKLEDALEKIAELDYEKIERSLVRQLRAYARQAKRTTAVVGLSGGLDSSATAVLAAKAFGKQNVIAALLPTKATKERDMQQARQVARKLGVQYVEFSVEGVMAAVERLSAHGLRPQTRIDDGNIAARARMICLYNLAARSNGLVIGTGDRSEIVLGYFTKYGDGGADVLPIAGLYKTQVKRLAEKLRIQREIIEKPPSPNLWLGQTAEEKLGASYEELDVVLWALFERGMAASEIEKKFGIKKWLVERVENLRAESVHKRKTPPALNPFE